MGIIKRFIVQSKVLEITIGMIVAVAFERVVATMVSGILMPLFKIIRNEIMGDYKTTVGGGGPQASANSVVAVEYEGFIEAVMVFLIIVFFIVKGIKKIELLRKKQGLNPEDTASGSDHLI